MVEAPRRWHQRAHHSLRHSLKKRLVALFILMALAVSAVFVFGMQKAFSVGWRDAARPLLADYIDRITADIGTPPSPQRAQALTQRLPVTVRISGPQVNWQSHPGDADEHRWRGDDWQHDEPRLLSRTTADGHRIDYGLSVRPWRDRPRFIGWATLAALLGITWAAYAYVRGLLRPLDDIRVGAQRFGLGVFDAPIPVRRRDELGDLAADVNTMASSIHQMLEAKRGLLLAISHELRSPLTRARVHTELLPEAPPDIAARRAALLRDLGEMRDLVSELLESERLGQGHAALHLEPTDLAALVREVAAGLEIHDTGVGEGGPSVVRLALADALPSLALDRTRVRLLVRNLLDNALRHNAGAGQPPQVTLQRGGTEVVLTVRDYGPGVDESALPHLTEPFWRPDASRERATGGVGLGLYLCKLVVQAHGGRLTLRNVGAGQPGFEACVEFPSTDSAAKDS
ncbi:MAG: HAMP domain-containing protein [Ramlibacter sp.]|nr:HAMP domain-containing protein [Ramlibacter sp.]